jgi:hypothetical protein
MSNAARATLHGENPRPRLLIAADEPANDNNHDSNWQRAQRLADDLGRLFPTIRIATPKEVENDIREAEFDVVVDFGAGLKWPQRPLHRLVIGGRGDIGSFTTDEGRFVCRRSGRSKATEFLIPTNLSAELHDLVRDLCDNALRVGGKHILQSRFIAQPQPSPADEPALNPLVLDPDNNVLAAWIEDPHGKQTWMLPSGVDAATWVTVLLTRWNRELPSQFPMQSAWEVDTRWQSPAERALHAELRAIEADRKRVLDELNAREATARSALAQAKHAADIHERLLVSTQGPELERGVQQCLEALGFDAVHQDITATNGDKLEDLRVTMPSKPGWVVLAEVKGNRRGTALRDLLKVSRFIKRYIQETGQEPSAVWFIANPSVGSGPENRQPPLQSNHHDVEAWAKEERGLVIDTADLLEAWMAVKSGAVSAADIRQSLMESTGYWQFRIDISQSSGQETVAATK